jgi:hypothetical protein
MDRIDEFVKFLSELNMLEAFRRDAGIEITLKEHMRSLDSELALPEPEWYFSELLPDWKDTKLGPKVWQVINMKWQQVLQQEDLSPEDFQEMFDYFYGLGKYMVETVNKSFEQGGVKRATITVKY